MTPQDLRMLAIMEYYSSQDKRAEVPLTSAFNNSTIQALIEQISRET
jgi:hypothetical protein